ncbi:hypothetical protein P154DRAFT_571746 [Amniculicola lignicola CBS 123094]|uniref:DUF1279 domain-containing protein n=1 Tax=Amniculicola lignicola CBS 123094 TaxID=1392246 RepID=A0A6A5X273_9PLEO|nr:hypothetical protein P154DRAFT_571746 [Amniculicola lignicola CBS 123094]
MQSSRLWSRQVGIQSALSRPSTARHHAPAVRSFFTSTQAPARSTTRFAAASNGQSQFCRYGQSILSRRFRSFRFKSDKASPSHAPNPTPHLGSPEPPLSLSQRLKKLSKEYGWTAVGVYFALSALDFPFCFLAVRTIGTDKIGHYEHVAMEAFWNAVRIVFPDLAKQQKTPAADVSDVAQATGRDGDLGWSGEVEAAETANKGAEASIWTQLALAYAIHKSFIFIRIPLTAAILPKVVKTLRKWGYDIGKKKPKSS